MISTVAVPRSDPAAPTLRSALLVLVLAGIGSVVLSVSCADEAPIDRLTIVNPTPFDVNVEVADSDKEGWLILGLATHESSTIKEFVTDMGPTWVFRFHYGGKMVGELTLSREELERERWSFEVPSDVGDQMRKLGFERPPER